MSTYENDTNKKIKEGVNISERLDISLVKYFWQASPLSSKDKNIPKFLRGIRVLKNFTDNELRIFSQFLHKRCFDPDECIFEENDLGIGFYLVFNGAVEISLVNQGKKEVVSNFEKFDYFGELALLQDGGNRNVTAMAKNTCELLGLFKPDLDELISSHPVVATKLLQSISVILAERINGLTAEIKNLKMKLNI